MMDATGRQQRRAWAPNRAYPDVVADRMSNRRTEFVFDYEEGMPEPLSPSHEYGWWAGQGLRHNIGILIAIQMDYSG